MVGIMYPTLRPQLSVSTNPETYTISRTVKIIDLADQIVGCGFLVRESCFITASSIFTDYVGELRVKISLSFDQEPRTIGNIVNNAPFLSLAYVSSFT